MDEGTRDRWLALADHRLRVAGFRAGAARAAILQVLAVDGQCLISAAVVGERLRPQTQASIATIYRTLETLHDLGLLHRVVGEGGSNRYELVDPAGHHHHHFVDERTGEITPFQDEELERVIERLAARLDIELEGHDVTLRGHPRGARPTGSS